MKFDLNGLLKVVVAAGSAVMGKVGIDQTTPGTTNAVAIDQTSQGTTNGVQLKAGTAAFGALTAGEAHLGEVTSDGLLAIPVTVTLSVGSAYASGDFVGTSATPITFANAARVSGGGGRVVGVVISDPAASVAAALELWLFNATMTPPTDSAAWDCSDPNGLKAIAIIPMPTTDQFLSSATGVISTKVANGGAYYTCAATSLFGALVTRGAPTYTGTLQVTLLVERK